jgi:hypothetical protein
MDDHVFTDVVEWVKKAHSAACVDHAGGIAS